MKELQNGVSLRVKACDWRTNSSVAAQLYTMQEAAVEDGDGGGGQMASDERAGGGIQYVISSFEPQPESQMMHL